ncbi:MAG TPA: hypothetical protein GXX37_10420 [Clostridiaceae bacterium]|nr:hypothetical protein [Clostridiaceae bacterium]
MENQIWKITPICFQKGKENEMTRKIYKMLMKWIVFADRHFETWDVRPNCGYFFGGSYWYATDTSNTVLVYALLATLGEYDEKLTGIPRDELIRKAIKGIRYLGFTHDTGPEDCVRVEGPNPHASRTKWGGKNDDFFKASQHGVSISDFGIAAWLLWDYLDDETKMMVQAVVSSYADRWSKDILENYEKSWSVNEPKTGTYNNTQTEENAWTSLGISVAATMFSTHPKAEGWKKAADVWAANTCTTYLDRYIYDPSIPYNRFMSVTTHPDYTAENHGFVHPNYMASGITLRGKVALMHLMAGIETPMAYFYHWEDVYENTLKVWCDRNGLPIPIQGQDWWYNNQPAVQLLHCLMNVFKSNKDAALLERITIDTLEKIQESNGNGCLYEKNGEECRITEFQTAKDMERSAAVSLVESYLLHYFGGMGAEPTEYNEFFNKIKGVYYYPYGNSIIYRTEDTFAGFSWRSNVMGFSFPQKGLWTITPITCSYIGIIELMEKKGFKALSNESIVRCVKDEKILPKENGFAVTSRIERGGKQLIQDISFTALPDGKTVYIEKIFANENCEVKKMETGLVGVRNESYSNLPKVAKGYRTLYLDGGRQKTFYGYYGKGPDIIEKWNNVNYLNIDNEIGYVCINSNGVKYINKHQYPKWKGIEEQLILNNYENHFCLTRGEGLKPFVVVTAPNQELSDTAELARKTAMLNTSCYNTIVICVQDKLIYTNFNYKDITIEAKKNIQDDYIYLFKGYNSVIDGVFTWKNEVEKRENGWLQAGFKIRYDKEMCFEAYVPLENVLILTNRSKNVICIKVEEQKRKKVQKIILNQNETKTMEF